MEQTPIEKEASKHNVAIDDFEDFNFDDLSFKPINKGLGFHHNEKRASFKKPEVTTVRKHMGKPLAKESMTQPQGVKVVQTGISNLGVTQNISTVTSKSNLDMFYGDSSKNTFATKQSALSEKLEAKVIQKEEVSHFISFVSWLVDLISITLFVLVTITLFVLVSGIEFNELLALVSESDQILFVYLVFSSIYILYFSILDLASSPGKALLGLNLEKTDGSNLSLTNTFLRSLVSLLSIFSLGVLSFLNLSGKISKTRIVS